MSARTVQDQLREEYFALLPEIRRTVSVLEAEMHCLLVPTLQKLGSAERVQVESRVKDCESAIAALRRRQEGRDFEPARQYSLTSLKDLAGVRILAFPDNRLLEIDCQFRERFAQWIADPVLRTASDADRLAQKYYGYCDTTSRIRAEIQIVPMLVGLFWRVEHAALYKPAAKPRGIEREEEELNARNDDVIRALQAFERAFANRVSA